MAQVNDCMMAALEVATGETGNINDLLSLYLESLIVGTPNGYSIPDLWDTIFDEAAIAAGAFNDRLMLWLTAQGATGAALADQWHDYWCSVMAPV